MAVPPLAVGYPESAPTRRSNFQHRLHRRRTIRISRNQIAGSGQLKSRFALDWFCRVDFQRRDQYQYLLAVGMGHRANSLVSHL